MKRFIWTWPILARDVVKSTRSIHRSLSVICYKNWFCRVKKSAPSGPNLDAMVAECMKDYDDEDLSDTEVILSL